MNCVISSIFSPTTPLEVVFKLLCPTLLDVLLEHKIDVKRTYYGGVSVLELLVAQLRPSVLRMHHGYSRSRVRTVTRMAQRLISVGALESPSLSPSCHAYAWVISPAIYNACACGDFNLVKLLVENGADITLKLCHTTRIMTETTVITTVAGLRMMETWKANSRLQIASFIPVTVGPLTTTASSRKSRASIPPCTVFRTETTRPLSSDGYP